MSKLREERYYVDKRVGCIAVRDRTLDNDEQCLHPDTTGVMKYWSGSNSPEFGGWGVSEQSVSDAYDEAIRLNNLPEVEAGDEWVHRNGCTYIVDLFTNVGSTESKYPETVVYHNVDSLKDYSRPLTDWHRSMTLVKTN